jgi:zinc transporter
LPQGRPGLSTIAVTTHDETVAPMTKSKNTIAGKDDATVLPGLASAFRFNASGAAEALSVEQPLPRRSNGFLWLHFDSSNPDTPNSVESIPGISALAKAVLVGKNERQQLFADEICIFGVFADLFDESDDTDNTIRFVQFAVTANELVTSADFDVRAGDLIQELSRRREKIRETAALVEALFNSILDRADDYIKTFAEKLDDTEESLLSGTLGDQRQTLAQIRRDTVRLSRQTAISLSLVRRFENENARRAGPPVRLATDKLTQRLDWLNSEIVAIRERAHLLQDEAMLKTADQTNQHLQVLAIVATVFLPASLIAGIFGMNVKGLPLTDTNSGFFWSMVLLGGASIFVYWLLKRSGILGPR